ncbi:hypothetical protein E3U55_16180 [Filobacillus milosensis]|uniref:Uncharacterized protein n=1 Tax=Filobacillus milosensis TaxID=94137 RepID=A0A4Y8IEY3_9BACI|nr:hypothetical protein [Filobacillus milosensis]TFB13378.1 hypothetical protein E3U55_16180 [Filobacillus milosensis]
MKHKLLWVSLVVITLSTIGNSIYYQAQQIEEPIFLDHYYTKSIDGSPLKFSYITNKQDTSRVSYVTINGHDFYLEQDTFFYQSNNQSRNVYEYQHHAIRELFITLKENQLQDIKKPFRFTEMTVHFADGSSVVADIGKVILKDRENNTQSEAIFENRHYGTGGGRVIISKNFNKNAQIQSIYFPFEEARDNIETKLKTETGTTKEEWQKEIDESDSHPVFPMIKAPWEEVPGVVFEGTTPYPINEGQQLYVYTKINENINSIYGLEYFLEGTTDDKEEFSIHLHMHEEPFLSQEQINELIETKGEKQ